MEGGGHEEEQPAWLESEMLSLGAAVSSEAARHVVCAVWVRLPLWSLALILGPSSHALSYVPISFQPCSFLSAPSGQGGELLSFLEAAPGPFLLGLQAGTKPCQRILSIRPGGNQGA